MIKNVSTQVDSYFLALNELSISVIIYLSIQLRLILIIRNDQIICQIELSRPWSKHGQVGHGRPWSKHGQTMVKLKPNS